MAKEKWPNFFIVGVSKAGITSLYEYLKRVPGIYMSPVKESRYFAPGDRPGHGIRPIRSKAKYLKLFHSVKDEAAVGEASPSYLYGPEAPKLIHEVVPYARIIMILRDPVERAYAHYLMWLRETWESRPFDEAVREDRYLKLGFYSEPVHRYLQIFGAPRVKILIFEEFIQDIKETVGDVLKFLDVNGKPPDGVAEAYNTFALPRGPLARLILRSNLLRSAGHSLLPARLRRIVRERVLLKRADDPPMPQEAREILEELYRDDVQRLEKILARSLPWSPARN